jgi:hypothetical protein
VRQFIWDVKQIPWLLLGIVAVAAMLLVGGLIWLVWKPFHMKSA